jgi:hypothetical protein
MSLLLYKYNGTGLNDDGNKHLKIIIAIDGNLLFSRTPYACNQWCHLFTCHGQC